MSLRAAVSISSIVQFSTGLLGATSVSVHVYCSICTNRHACKLPAASFVVVTRKPHCLACGSYIRRSKDMFVVSNPMYSVHPRDSVAYESLYQTPKSPFSGAFF